MVVHPQKHKPGGLRAYSWQHEAMQVSNSWEPTVADKSPKKSSGKTPAAKSLKEKRADKNAKAQSRSNSETYDAVNKKR